MFYKICVIKNFAKLLGKHQFRSLFIIKLQVSILLLQAFSDNFVSITDIFFAYHLQATASVSWKVILPIKWKLLVRKTTEHAGTKQKNYLHRLFIFFYCSKIDLFLFSLLPVIHWKHVCLETIMQGLRIYLL